MRNIKAVLMISVSVIIGVLSFILWKSNSELRSTSVFMSEDVRIINLNPEDVINVFSNRDEGVFVKASENKYELKSTNNIPDKEVLRIVFSNEKKILLSNTKFIIYIDIENNMKERFIDLTKLDYFGNDRSEVSVDRSGENIIYSCFNEKENMKYVYYIDVKEGTGIKIGENPIEDFVDSWSYNSNYYAYGDKEGKKIVVFDVENLEVNKIDFKRDYIKKVLITNKGEVFAEGNKKYVIRRNENYELAECVIAGNFLSSHKNMIISFKNGIFYGYENGAMTKLNEVSEQFNVVKQVNHNVLLSDESGTIIYNIENNKLHKYSFKYEYLDMIIPSIDGNRCLIKSKRYNNRIIGSNGQYYKVKDINLMKIIGDCSWIDEENIIGIYYTEYDKPIIFKVQI
ncbi:hypothetical protein [Oceanirhabdus sp. W0125-5]|uniref:hypothetical protein n=1 Tax=Oceanirhabdus sp. W0125-5 TaxID=2999116 RepID=UPI0022F304A7|nr:hypothetical protein [Oceanirhabdus sp. W0125-5]WBW97354.1 hypothetical protein OW730_00435 [Oceanirhabdus sp. W0125-5]